MSVLELMAHAGKTVSVTLQNGFILKGNMKNFSNNGIFLDKGDEFVFLNHFEIKNIQTV